MTDRSVQVPVSLIERLIGAAYRDDLASVAEARALLSQPTQTAEPTTSTKENTVTNTDTELVSIERHVLETLEECVRKGIRHSDAADAAWEALGNPKPLAFPKQRIMTVEPAQDDSHAF